jgi:hypothetical protein
MTPNPVGQVCPLLRKENTMTTLEQNLVFVKGLVQLMDKEAADARELEQKILRQMPEYWTPYGGHTMGKKITISKWKDFLFICQGGLKFSDSEDARNTWYRLQCVVLGDLKEFELKP